MQLMLDIPETTPDAGALDIEQPDMSITDALALFLPDTGMYNR